MAGTDRSAGDRRERLAAALRDNLRRRKRAGPVEDPPREPAAGTSAEDRPE